MSIQQECETLQAFLNATLELIAEIDATASHLPECGISESPAKISLLLELCNDGQQNLQKSLEQIELLASILGVSSTSMSEAKSTSKSSKEISEEQFLDFCMDHFKKFRNLTVEILSYTAKSAKTAWAVTMMATSIVGGLMAQSIRVYDEIVSPAVDIGSNLVAPGSPLARVKKILDDGTEWHLGANFEEYEQLDVDRKRRREEEDRKRRREEEEEKKRIQRK